MKLTDSITTMLEEYIQAGSLAGVATLSWRAGREAEVHTVGWRDIAAGLPMTRDTLFRIASMTKPVTSLAALRLMEAGRFALSDPITRWAPEFAEMRVLRAADGALEETTPAERPITFEDLLTHRAGLTYGLINGTPIEQAYEAALGSTIDSHLTPDEWLERLAALPLVGQPGAGFCYSHAADVLGLLLGRMEGGTLGEVLAQWVFAPLGMRDTGFGVPPEQRHRRAALYGYDDAGRLAPRPTGALKNGRGGTLLAERPADLAYEAGGQGLWSTLDDYLAFARLFVGDGAVEGVRLLRPETLRRMMTNQLSDAQRTQTRMVGGSPFAAHGFGLGLAVVLDPARAWVARGRGGVGTVSWPGAYGTWWQADPTNGTVLIFMAQTVMELDQLAQGIGLEVYGAIERFHELAARK